MGRGRPKGSKNRKNILMDNQSDNTNSIPKKRGRKPKLLDNTILEENNIIKYKNTKNRKFSLIDDSGSKYWLTDDIVIKDIEGNIIKYHKFLLPETRVNYRKNGDIYPINGIQYFYINDDVDKDGTLVFVVGTNDKSLAFEDNLKEHNFQKPEKKNIFSIFNKKEE